eukprot:TRINITY_DN15366_c0_g1_i1.p1 TRINITY_DN15366_c0_g1~~TRINITY_DN15366_c0_g1_i1.p1  ORF type:complete len:118 (-),score=16.13 TRINITY_DN15366_c0_g1_i1:15-368(-)
MCTYIHIIIIGLYALGTTRLVGLAVDDDVPTAFLLLEGRAFDDELEAMAVLLLFTTKEEVAIIAVIGEGVPPAVVDEGCCCAPVSYTHLRAHETPEHLVCRLLLEKKKKNTQSTVHI